MKVVYLVPLLLLAFLSRCSVTSTIPPEGVAEFIVGFVEGLAVEVSNNITKCVEDVNVTLDDFDTGFELLDAGFKSLNPSEVASGLKDIGKGIGETALVLKVCGAPQLAEDIANIGRQIEEGKLLLVILKEVLDILHNEKVLTQDFKNASKAWHEKDYLTSGKYIGEIVAILLKD